MQSTYDWMTDSLISNGSCLFALANTTVEHYTGNTITGWLFTGAVQTAEAVGAAGLMKVAAGVYLVDGLANLALKQHASNLQQQHNAQEFIEDLTQQQKDIGKEIRELSQKLTNKRGHGNKKEKAKLKALNEQLAEITSALEYYEYHHWKSESHWAVKTVADLHNTTVNTVSNTVMNTVSCATRNIGNAIEDSQGHIMAVRAGIITNAIALETAKVVAKVPGLPTPVKLGALTLAGDFDTVSKRLIATGFRDMNVSNNLFVKMCAAHIEANGTIPLENSKTTPPRP